MLQLPKGEASLHLQHADQELTLKFFKGESWKLHIVDTSGLPLKEGEAKEYSTTLAPHEAGALLFLWANCDDAHDDLTSPMYDILERFLASCPRNLRPIP